MVNVTKGADVTLTAFQSDLTREDELGKVIRAHLHLENWVDRILELHFPNMKAIHRLQIEYSLKVGLLSGFTYTTTLTKPLLAFGTLRNAFAHRLDSKLTADRMKSLYDSFDRHGKEGIQNSYQRSRHQSKGQSKVPKKMQNLAADDLFVLYAISIHAMLEIAHRQAKAAKEPKTG